MSSPARSKKPATYEDLLRVPDNLVAEIVGGDLYASPRPAFPHAVASSALGSELGGPFQQGRGGPGGWWIIDEPELHFADDIVVPDLGGWRRSRLPRIPAEAFLSLAPDWICEILSPSTETLDRARKLAVYAREGVDHAWLVNPTVRTLEVLRLESGRWVLLATHAGGETVRAEPFDALELELRRLWGDPETADSGQP
jgi:Uma2 family endonuclease